VDPADRELEPGPAGPRLGLAGLRLASLATAGHPEDTEVLKIPKLNYWIHGVDIDLKEMLHKGTYFYMYLAAEAVEGAPLPLEGLDHVHGGDGLPLVMLGVGDGVPDHVLHEDLEDAAGLLKQQARYPLDEVERTLGEGI
jgi:hypothetical protein